MVLTIDGAVRRWIERQIEPATGQYGSARSLRPRVLALDEVNPAALLRADRPYLAPLAVAGHAGAPEATVIGEAAVDITLGATPAHLASDQLDAILGMVDEALRAHLENRIMEHQHTYRSELFRGIFEKGQAEGKAEGEVEGRATSILAVLAARGIPVSVAVRRRILACTSVETLDEWIQRAAVAPTAAAVVRPDPAGTKPRAAVRKRTATGTRRR